MKKILLVVFGCLTNLILFAQTTITGEVKITGSLEPAPNVTVILSGANESVMTDGQGKFSLVTSKSGNDLLVLSHEGLVLKQLTVLLKADETINLGEILVNAQALSSSRDDVALTLSESELNDDNENSQSVSGLLSSRGDVFSSTAGYVFGSMRFRQRGYNSSYNTTYINGVEMNNAERGSFNYSSIGGLNDMVRSKDVVNGIDQSSFSFGSLGGATNIDARASSIRKGLKVGQVVSNRSYTTRTMLTYGTGLLENGWSFAASGSFRWGNSGFVQGTSYNAWAYALALEKRIGDSHRISLTTMGAPTERGQQSASTQEAYDLTPKLSIFNTKITKNGNPVYGNNFYNANWGYQDGKVRNARMVKGFTPITVLSHTWLINELSRLTTSLGYKYQIDGRTALNWYNSADPRPDYYRNLPNYYLTLTPPNTTAAELRQYLWQSDESYRQIDWDELYRVNYLANATGKSGRYLVENKRNDQSVITLNSVLNYVFDNNWRLDAGFGHQYTQGKHFKLVDDLLGANYWVDVDQYGERDNPGDPNFLQNNLLDPNRKVKVGDIFGYNYNINVHKTHLWAQTQYSGDAYDVYASAKVQYTGYNREGFMKNGRAADSLYIPTTFNGKALKYHYVDGSYGKSPMQNFLTYGVKLGGNYRITGRHIISMNIANGTNAPLSDNAYFAARIKANLIPDLTPETYLAIDLNYYFRTPIVNGRFTVYNTNFWNSSKLSSFYNDEYNTYVNFAMYDFNKRHTGAELGLEVKVSNSVTLVGVAAYGQNVYTSNPTATVSYENGLNSDVEEKIYVDGFHIDGTPELATNIGVKYFHPKYWFLELNLNYYTSSYMDFNPLRRTEGAIAGLDPENPEQAALISQIRDQERLKGGFTVDASVGKSFRFNYKYFLNINLSANNILNNTNLKTGGYEQSRFSANNSSTDRATYLKRFPNKYYYAYGTTFYLNIGFRF